MYLRWTNEEKNQKEIYRIECDHSITEKVIHMQHIEKITREPRNGEKQLI